MVSRFCRFTQGVNELALTVSVKIESNSQLTLFILGAALLTIGLDERAYAGYQTDHLTDRMLNYIEGPFGALVTAAAGIGAIVASALGGFKAAWTLLVTAIGAFILRSYITMWFGEVGKSLPVAPPPRAL